MKDFQATAIEREHPALQNMKFFFFFLRGSFPACPDPEFRIQRLYCIRSQFGKKSETLLETPNPVVKTLSVRPFV
jgi:hypothetical protein